MSCLFLLRDVLFPMTRGKSTALYSAGPALLQSAASENHEAEDVAKGYTVINVPLGKVKG